MGFLKFRRQTTQFVREQGGMYELYKTFADLFIEDGFHLREVTNDSLYLHYGTNEGKIGVQIIQLSTNKTTIIVGEELPFKRRNSFKIETNPDFPAKRTHYRIISRLQLVEYPIRKPSSEELLNLNQVARTQFEKGNIEQSLKLYQKLERLTDVDVNIILLQAACHVKLGDDKSALNLCNKAEKIDPSAITIYSIKGELLLKTNKNLALAEFIKGKDMGSDHCTYQYLKLSEELRDDIKKYNSQGKLINHKYMVDGFIWEEKFTYDQDNNLVRIDMFAEDEDGKYSLEPSNTFEYDEHGIIMQKIIHNLGSFPDSIVIFNNILDDYGRIIEQFIEKSNGIYLEKYKIKYINNSCAVQHFSKYSSGLPLPPSEKEMKESELVSYLNERGIKISIP